MRRPSLAVLALALLVAAPAAAQPSVTAPEPPAVTTETEWYGYWTLAADGAALVIGGAGENFQLGLGAYALGGPIVHLVKGNHLGAGLSLAARVGIPLALGFWGHQTDEEECAAEDDDKGGCGYNAAAGAILGILLASVVDAALIARHTVEVQRVPSWTLLVAPSNGSGVVVGVGGAW